MATIYTRDDNWKNIQQRNVCKGLAFQRAFQKILIDNGVKKENIEETITNFFNIINKNYEKNPMFNVKKKFKFKGRLCSPHLTDETYFSFNSIPNKEIVVHDKVKEKYVLYGKDAKKCSGCGIVISYDYLKTRKCFRCNNGYFVGKHITETTKVCKNRETFLEYLVKEGYIGKINIKKLKTKKRLDGWFYINKTLHIFETKNKECTGLNFSDVRQILTYLKILIESGIVIDKAYVIYNGDLNISYKQLKHLEFREHEFYEKSGVLNVIEFEEWLDLQNFKSLNFNKITIKNSKKGKLYDFSYDSKICTRGRLLKIEIQYVAPKTKPSKLESFV